jgi:hypothetical protein
VIVVWPPLEDGPFEQEVTVPTAAAEARPRPTNRRRVREVPVMGDLSLASTVNEHESGPESDL